MANTTASRRKPTMVATGRPTVRLVRGAKMRPEDLEVVSADVPPGELHLYRRINAPEVRKGDVIERPRCTVRVADHGRVFEVDFEPVRVEVTAVGRDAWSGMGGERYARRVTWHNLATGKVIDIREPHVADPLNIVLHLGRFIKRGPTPKCGGCCSCNNP